MRPTKIVENNTKDIRKNKLNKNQAHEIRQATYNRYMLPIWLPPCGIQFHPTVVPASLRRPWRGGTSVPTWALPGAFHPPHGGSVVRAQYSCDLEASGCLEWLSWTFPGNVLLTGEMEETKRHPYSRGMAQIRFEKWKRPCLMSAHRSSELNCR